MAKDVVQKRNIAQGNQQSLQSRIRMQLRAASMRGSSGAGGGAFTTELHVVTLPDCGSPDAVRQRPAVVAVRQESVSFVI